MADQWTPIKWRLGPARIETHHLSVFIETRGQRDGTERYVISNALSEVFNRAGEWEWEPQPSSRTDDFIARTRFSSYAEAADFYERAAISEVPS